MGRFLDDLDYRRTGEFSAGRPVRELLHPFRYAWNELEPPIYVHAGFRTDLSSVPRFCWRIVPPWTGEEAAVIHDYLCETKQTPRFVTDAIFRAALADAGVGPLTRWAMWFFVRCYAVLTRKK